MSDEKIRNMAEEALTRLASEIEAGKSEALKNYLATMGRFHRYSWGNVLLIHSQRPNATRVAGFHAWHEVGRWVQKNEKGIMIFAPVLVKRHEQQPREQPSDGQQTPNEVAPARLSGFRTAYVYDISQTQGRPLPEFAQTTGDPKDHGEKLKGFASKRGISVEYDRTIAPALGVSSGGRIRLIPGLKPAEEFSVLAHELAHEMLHHREETRSQTKVVRETQAEAVAFVVSRAVGLETNNAAADYITLYNGDKKTLADSLAVIQETSAQILDELLPEKRTPFLEQPRANSERVASTSERAALSGNPLPATTDAVRHEPTLDR
ncbi:MAG: ArdC family protein [Bryobacteraceae bacterium]